MWLLLLGASSAAASSAGSAACGSSVLQRQAARSERSERSAWPQVLRPAEERLGPSGKNEGLEVWGVFLVFKKRGWFVLGILITNDFNMMCIWLLVVSLDEILQLMLPSG